MTRRKKLGPLACVAVYSSAFANAAMAQEPLNAVDYKAAYCAGRLRDATVPQQSASFPPAANDVIRQLSNQIDRARARLKIYLLSRLSYVDATSLLATTELGAKEQREYEEAAKACVAKGGGVQSYDAKRASDCAREAGWSKLKECEEAAFLPF